jgi:catechol 2,3-dioxygenase-like lactoylglutathione lyase family enzyme
VFQGVDHPVIAVRELDAAAECYGALLGRPAWWRGIHPGAGTANALFRLANTSLELLAPEGEGPIGRVVASALERSGEGLAALAFATDDAGACAAALRARGIEAGSPRPGEGSDPASGAVRRWLTVDIPLTTTRGLLLFGIERTEGPQAPEGEVEASGVEGLDHVVVTTSDLDAARAFYGDALGLRLALDRRFEARSLRILFFRVGGVTVEVVGPHEAPEVADSADAFGGLAWRVGDADAARARVAAAGFDVSEVRDGAKPGTRVCTVRSGTCGVSTLLIGPDV